MDRNLVLAIMWSTTTVALRKESVDRNSVLWERFKLFRRVALRKESVDRNVSTL